MIYQQLTSSVRRNYAGSPAVAELQAEARRCREWVEHLEIDPVLRETLVEPHRALEQAFEALARLPAAPETSVGEVGRAADGA
jgi:hypothetical protein